MEDAVEAGCGGSLSRRDISTFPSRRCGSSISISFQGRRASSLAHEFFLMQFLGVDTSTGSLTSSQVLLPDRTSEERTTSRAHSCWGDIHLGGDRQTLQNSRQRIVVASRSAFARLDKPWKRVERRMQRIAHNGENTGFWVRSRHTLN